MPSQRKSVPVALAVRIKAFKMNTEVVIEELSGKEGRRLENEYNSLMRKMVQEFVVGIKTEEPEFCRNARLDFLLSKATELKTRLDLAKIYWKRDKKNRVPVMDRMVRWYLAATEKTEKKLRQLWVEIKMRALGLEYGNGISQEQIELADSIPIEEIYPELPKMISCINPAHNDKNPSMSIARGFANCFSCGASYSTVGFVKEKEKLNFKQAVNFILDNSNTEQKKEIRVERKISTVLTRKD